MRRSPLVVFRGVNSRGPDQLSGAYAAAWATRIDLADDSLQILYTAMHRADLDRFLEIDNPLLEFVTTRWQRGGTPGRFTQDLRRNAIVLQLRLARNAVTATAAAVRTILRAGKPSQPWRVDPQFQQVVGAGYLKSEVDAFVSRVQAALRDPSATDAVSPEEIIEKRFERSHDAPGYREDDVDQWLDEAELRLRDS